MNKPSTTTGLTLTQNMSAIRSTVGARVESRILMVGISVTCAFVLWLGLSWMWSPEYCRNIISLAVTRIIVGRPGGIYFGHILGLSVGANIAVNTLVDAVAVLIIYPLFVFSVEHICPLHVLSNFIKRIHRTARRHYVKIRVYGIPWLFLFVLFPLWGTGPLVGSVVGYIMHLRPWANMGIVLSATLLAIILWAGILAEFYLRVLAYGSYLPVMIIVGFFIGMICFRIIRQLRQNTDAR